LTRAETACTVGACVPHLVLAKSIFSEAERWRVGEELDHAIDKYGDAWEETTAALEAIVIRPVGSPFGVNGTGLLGVGSVATDIDRDMTLPESVVLGGNYPNPFNPSTTIRFGLPETTDMSLVVYDVMGREVARLVDGIQAAGYYEVTFSAGQLPTGTYLYRLVTALGTETGRMALVK
jgi:hypothetical protein